MKSYLWALAVCWIFFLPQAKAQFFNQDFNISTTVSDYASGTPNIRQFDNITNGTNNTISINTNRLRFARTAALQTASSITRATNIADKDGTAITTAMGSMMIRFTIPTTTLTGNVLTPLAGAFQIGTGFTANTSLEGTPYAQFGIHFGTANNTFRVSSGATSGTSNLTPGTTQRITVALNNSGVSLDYRAPDGTIETLANDKMDIWAGTTKIHDEIDVTNAAQTITDFKFVFNPTANFTLDIDDISIFPLEVFPTDTYTVGTNTTVATATATFTSLTRNGGGFFEVLNFINNINGANTFNINSSIATEDGANALLQLTGMSAGNMTTIKPSASAVLLTSSGAPAINFNGADNVTIDGGNNGTYIGTNRLTIRQTGNNVTVQFINDATNHTINDCIIESNSTSTNGSLFFSTGTTTGNDNISIANCTLRNRTDSAPSGGTGTTTTINIPRTAINSTGSSAAITNDLIVFDNCELVNFFSGSNNTNTILIGNNTKNFTFKNSHIYQTVSYFGNNSFTTYSQLIQVNATNTDNITVEGNYFGGRDRLCGGGKFIYSNPNGNRCRLIVLRSNMSSGTTITIQNNTIANIQSDFQGTNTGGADAFNGFTGSGKMIIKDNIFTNLRFSQTTNGAPVANATIQPIVYSGDGTGEITSNKIEDIQMSFTASPTNGFTFEGIRLSPASNGLSVSSNIVGHTVANNSIVSNVHTSLNTLLGISISNNITHSILNNTIANITNNSTNTGSTLYAINQTGNANNTIQNNTIYNLTSTAQQTNLSDNVTVAGIRINAATGTGLQVSDNIIHSILSTATTATTSAGILFTGGGNGSIQRNRVYNISNTSGASPSVSAGIILRNVGSALTTYNNMISLGLGDSDNQDRLLIGIWNNFSDTDTLRLYFNTINIAGTSTGSTYKTYGFLRGDNDGNGATLITTPVRINNNIFHNQRTGLGNHFAIGNQETPLHWKDLQLNDCSNGDANEHRVVDFNAFYSAIAGNIGEWEGTAYDFGGWRFTASGNDINSQLLTTPITVFTNEATADLHVSNDETRINAKGLPLTGFKTDFDGTTRRGPDIGADEFRNTLTSSTSGDWHIKTTWIPEGIPTHDDIVIIETSTEVFIQADSLGFFSDLLVKASGILELQGNATLTSCWRDGSAVNHGTIEFLDNATLNIASNLENNGTILYGNGTTRLNLDRPEGLNCVLLDEMEDFNNDNNISNIKGTSDTELYNLTLLNTAQTTIENTGREVKVHNTMNMGLAGSTLTIGNNELFLNGTVIGNGTFTGSSLSKIEVGGITGGSLGILKFTPGASELHTLTMNRTGLGGDATLGDNLFVHNTLSLQAGVLNTGAQGTSTDILTLGTAGVVSTIPACGVNSGFSTNCITYVNGAMRKEMNTQGDFLFPVGKNGEYAPIKIQTQDNNASVFEAEYIDTGYPDQSPFETTGGLTAVSDNEHWYLNRIAGTSNAKVTLYWGDTYDDEALGRVGRWDGTQWRNEGGDPIYITAPLAEGGIESGVVGGFGVFTHATYLGVALPTNIINLAGKFETNKITLTWQTTQEENNLKFEILRSVNGKDFEKIGEKDGKGNSQQLTAYQFEDTQIQYGRSYYYQLRQVDFDEKAKLSSLIYVLTNGEILPKTIIAYDMQGKIVFKGEKETFQKICTANQVYIIKQGTHTYKMLKNSSSN
jgi:hypothetical protein